MSRPVVDTPTLFILFTYLALGEWVMYDTDMSRSTRGNRGLVTTMFYCAQCETVLDAAVDRIVCPNCNSSMDSMGWAEAGMGRE